MKLWIGQLNDAYKEKQWNVLPLNIRKIRDTLEKITGGTFESDNQKIQVLDSITFDAIYELRKDVKSDTKVKRIAKAKKKHYEEDHNDGYNTPEDQLPEEIGPAILPSTEEAEPAKKSTMKIERCQLEGCNRRIPVSRQRRNAKYCCDKHGDAARKRKQYAAKKKKEEEAKAAEAPAEVIERVEELTAQNVPLPSAEETAEVEFSGKAWLADIFPKIRPEGLMTEIQPGHHRGLLEFYLGRTVDTAEHTKLKNTKGYRLVSKVMKEAKTGADAREMILQIKQTEKEVLPDTSVDYQDFEIGKIMETYPYSDNPHIPYRAKILKVAPEGQDTAIYTEKVPGGQRRKFLLEADLLKSGYKILSGVEGMFEYINFCEEGKEHAHCYYKRPVGSVRWQKISKYEFDRDANKSNTLEWIGDPRYLDLFMALAYGQIDKSKLTPEEAERLEDYADELEDFIIEHSILEEVWDQYLPAFVHEDLKEGKLNKYRAMLLEAESLPEDDFEARYNFFASDVKEYPQILTESIHDEIEWAVYNRDVAPGASISLVRDLVEKFKGGEDRVYEGVKIHDLPNYDEALQLYQEIENAGAITSHYEEDPDQMKMDLATQEVIEKVKPEKPKSPLKEKYVVNEHKVVLNPDVIKIPIPKSLKFDAEITLAETSDGKWIAAADSGRNTGSMSSFASPVSISDIPDRTFETKTDAITAMFKQILNYQDTPDSLSDKWNTSLREKVVDLLIKEMEKHDPNATYMNISLRERLATAQAQELELLEVELSVDQPAEPSGLTGSEKNDLGLTLEETQNMVRIGFDKPSSYKQSVWRKAVKVMDRLTEYGYVEPFDYGRGKGKFRMTETGQRYDYDSLGHMAYYGKPTVKDPVYDPMPKGTRVIFKPEWSDGDNTPSIVMEDRDNQILIRKEDDESLGTEQVDKFMVEIIPAAADPAEALMKYKLTADDEELAAKLTTGIQKAADLCKMKPPVCEDNLGIERKDMPQLEDEVVDKFLADLKKKGFSVTRLDKPIGLLKATQREINYEKVKKLAGLIEDGTVAFDKMPLIVSNDNYVLDGHHRWAASLVTDPSKNQAIYQVGMPIEKLLKASLSFEGVEKQDFADFSDKAAPEKELETDSPTANSNVRSWDSIPAPWRVAQKVSKVTWKPEPKDAKLHGILLPFLGVDDLRPVMMGAYWTGNVIVATDAHSLIVLGAKSPTNLVKNGPTIYYTGKSKNAPFKTGESIEGKYPNYAAVIPTSEFIYEVDFLKLRTYCEMLMKGEYVNKTTLQAMFKYGPEDDMKIGFNVKRLSDIAKTMLKLGHKTGYAGFSEPNRAAVFSVSGKQLEQPAYYSDADDGLLILLMPVVAWSGPETPLGAEDLDFGRTSQVYFDFTANEIRNADGSAAEFDPKLTAADEGGLDKHKVEMLNIIRPKNSSLPILEGIRIDEFGNAVAADLETYIEVPDTGLVAGWYQYISKYLSLNAEKDIEDYPKLPDYGDDYSHVFHMERVELLKILETVSKFTGVDDLRPAQTGIHITTDYDPAVPDEKIFILEATDTHAAVRYPLYGVWPADEGEEYHTGIMSHPKKIVKVLKKSKSDEITIYKSNKEVFGSYWFAIAGEDFTITTRAVNDKFPDVKSVFPAEYDHAYKVDTTTMRECFKEWGDFDKSAEKELFPLDPSQEYMNTGVIWLGQDGMYDVWGDAAGKHGDKVGMKKHKVCDYEAKPELLTPATPRLGAIFMPAYFPDQDPVVPGSIEVFHVPVFKQALEWANEKEIYIFTRDNAKSPVYISNDVTAGVDKIIRKESKPKSKPKSKIKPAKRFDEKDVNEWIKIIDDQMWGDSDGKAESLMSAWAWEGGADHNPVEIDNKDDGSTVAQIKVSGSSMVEHSGDVEGIHNNVRSLKYATGYFDYQGGRYQYTIWGPKVETETGEITEDSDYTVYVTGEYELQVKPSA